MNPRALFLLLMPAIALADPSPQVQQARLEQARAQLKSIGMKTDAKLEWRNKIEGAYGQTFNARLIQLNSSALRTRTELLNTLAHEMKHSRDFSRSPGWYEKRSGLAAENARLSAELNAAKGDQLTALYARIDANDQRLARLQFMGSREAVEARAFRAGAFALGRLGRPLEMSRRMPPNQPGYDPAQILPATANGYVLGAQRAFVHSPEFRALPRAAQKVARERALAYLGGFYDLVVNQVQNMYAEKPDPSLMPPPLSVRVNGLREQATQRLATPEELGQAGYADAWRGLRPHARFSELLATGVK